MAYLFVGAGEADFLSAFVFDSGITCDSGLPIAGVLIFLLLIFFVTVYPLFARGYKAHINGALSLTQRLAATHAIGLCPGRNGVARRTHGLRPVARHLYSERIHFVDPEHCDR